MTQDLSTFFIEVYQTQHGPRHSNDFTLLKRLKTVCSEISGLIYKQLLLVYIAERCL